LTPRHRIKMDREILLRNEFEKIIEILKKEYEPQQIILFGSLNSGRIREWSDIDLIVIKETGKSFFDRIKEVLLLVKPKVGLDVLIYTPREFDEIKQRLFFKEEILKNSKVIYERK
jgi:predicted nucleotidyltransferase